MIQVSELRGVLAEEVTRLQPPAGLESRVLERALRSMPAADHSSQRGARVRSPRVMALIAAMLAIAVVVTLVFTAHALNLTRNTPVRPGPTVTPVQVTPVPITALQIHGVSIKPGPTGDVFIRQPIPLQPPVSAPCAIQAARWGCSAPGVPTFGSPKVGWATNGSAAPEGPTNLYATVDGGRTWRSQLSWDYAEARDMRVSPDGKQAVIVSNWGWQGPAIFQTVDGGSSWTSMGFPLSAQQASTVASTPSQKNCKGTVLCSQDPGYFPIGQIYFLNPSEGWVLSQEPTFRVADLFHTTDGGGHWSLAARFDIKAQFGLDLATGVTLPLPLPLPSGKGGLVASVIHNLAGRLVFQSSSTGWFVPDYNSYPSLSLSVFRTLDGGASWRLQTVEAPPGLNSSNAAVVGVTFFDNHAGVLEVVKNLSGEGYVYTTSDSGATWSHPNLIPTDLPSLVGFIDAKNWEAWSPAGAVIRTSDAGQHWNVRAAGVPATGFQRGRFDFVDLSHGWVYTGNYLFGTTDGGDHWVKLTLPVVS